MKYLLPLSLIAILLSGCATIQVPQAFLQPNPAKALPAASVMEALPANYQYRSLMFHGDDGIQLHALSIKTATAQATVLYFGGQDFNIGERGLHVIKYLSALGVNALIVDYRGAGLSQGKPSLESLRSDALAAYDFLKTLKIGNKPIIVQGLSMGGFIAPYVATQRSVSGLVLESAATDVKGLVENLMDKQVPWYKRLFVSLDYAPITQKVNNVKALQNYDGPLLILVGDKDELTTPTMAHTLFKAAATPEALKKLVLVPGAKHAQIMYPPYVRKGVKAYRQFIQTVVKHASN